MFHPTVGHCLAIPIPQVILKVLQLIISRLASAQTFCRITVQAGAELPSSKAFISSLASVLPIQVLLMHAKPFGKLQRCFQHCFKDLGVARLVIAKWEGAHHEVLTCKVRQIEGFSASLWCHEERSALDRKDFARSNPLSHTKVNDLEVAMLVDEAVFAFEVQVGYSSLMQKLYGQDDGCRVELGLRRLQQA
eukprot:s381_g5.t1